MGPKVVFRSEESLSPWVTLVRKDVAFSAESPAQTYHCFKQADYVGILAVTTSGRIPLVRQYRPAVERYTWELPGGMLEPGESPEDCCRRELLEEAGLRTKSIQRIASQPAEVGRLENTHHMFFATTEDPDGHVRTEPGITLQLVTRSDLDTYILDGRLDHPLHLALIHLYELRNRQQT